MNAKKDDAKTVFLDLIEKNKTGKAKGIYSVCTANADVLEASLKQAKDDGNILLVESTSNQVNQDGGYTGMTAKDFIHFVKTIAQKVDFPETHILFGGDHLGPNPWQNRPAKEAMEKAKTLIADYVKEGYLKIHLDTSMFCIDDYGDRRKPLADEIVAQRTAELCKTAEKTWNTHRQGMPKPVYIIGTEVPIPGGAKEEEDQITPTIPEDASKTIQITKEYFHEAGLEEAWTRVVGVVVQPGVEFSDEHIFNYQRDKAKGLKKTISTYEHLVFEAHSTDYQTENNLKALVEDHFCILKVGPWLTFAYREALFALEEMEMEIFGKGHNELSNLSNILEKAMLGNPKYWNSYYKGDENQQSFKRKYSFSDRVRYYWPTPEVEESKKRLFRNLRNKKIPLSLLSQFMPIQFYRVCNGTVNTDPVELTHDYIQTVTGIYSRACGLSQ